MNAGKAGNGLRVLVIYWSATGNTKKVANTIWKALAGEGIKPVVKEV